MLDRIKELAREAGFNLDPDTGLILDTAGIYSVDDAARALATAVARECAEIVEEQAEALRAMNSKHEAAQVDMAADEIRAHFGIA